VFRLCLASGNSFLQSPNIVRFPFHRRKLNSVPHILLHSNYSPSSNGGIERVSRQLIDIFVANGYSVSCICGIHSRSSNSIYKGCFVHCRSVLCKIKGAPILSFGNISFIFASLRADLILFQEPFPGLWPAVFFCRVFLSKTLIVYVHARPSVQKPVQRLYDFFRQVTFGRSHFVFTSEDLLSKSSLNKDVNCSVIPIGLSDPTIEPSLSSVELPPKYILYFGRLSWYKGIPILLQAIAHLPDIFFVIAGTGTEAVHVSEFLESGSIRNLTFINRPLSEAEKNHLFHNALCVVFPSTSQSEAFGIVQLEAMAFSKPIVNTQLANAVNYVAPHGLCAITVQTCDVLALANAMHRLWCNPSLCMSLGRAGRDRYLALFSNRVFTDSWLKLVKDSIVTLP